MFNKRNHRLNDAEILGSRMLPVVSFMETEKACEAMMSMDPFCAMFQDEEDQEPWTPSLNKTDDESAEETGKEPKTTDDDNDDNDNNDDDDDKEDEDATGPELSDSIGSLTELYGRPALVKGFWDDDHKVDDPALFVVGSLLYLRCNWKYWGKISLPDNMSIDRVKEENYIRFRTRDGLNEVDNIIPVYYIDSLPENLFSSSDSSENEEDSSNSGLKPGRDTDTDTDDDDEDEDGGNRFGGRKRSLVSLIRERRRNRARQCGDGYLKRITLIKNRALDAFEKNIYVACMPSEICFMEMNLKTVDSWKDYPDESDNKANKLKSGPQDRADRSAESNDEINNPDNFNDPPDDGAD